MTANKQYIQLYNEVNQKINQLKESLSNHAVEQQRLSNHYGYVGDLNRVNEELDNVILFLDDDDLT